MPAFSPGTCKPLNNACIHYSSLQARLRLSALNYNSRKIDSSFWQTKLAKQTIPGSCVTFLLNSWIGCTKSLKGG